MLATYAAVLRGERLEWVGEAPPIRHDAAPMRVHVTVLEGDPAPAPSGAAMAAALERLAAMGGLPEYGDPVEWQREIRKDRPMPGREP